MLRPLEDEFPAQMGEDDEALHGALRDRKLGKSLLCPPQPLRVAEVELLSRKDESSGSATTSQRPLLCQWLALFQSGRSTTG